MGVDDEPMRQVPSRVPTMSADRSSFELMVKPEAARRLHIDAQPDSIVVRRELDHDPALRRAIQVGHGEYAPVIQSGENLLKLRAFGAVDVQNPGNRRFHRDCGTAAPGADC